MGGGPVEPHLSYTALACRRVEGVAPHPLCAREVGAVLVPNILVWWLWGRQRPLAPGTTTEGGIEGL